MQDSTDSLQTDFSIGGNGGEPTLADGEFESVHAGADDAGLAGAADEKQSRRREALALLKAYLDSGIDRGN